MLSSKERLLLSINHKEPDHIPLTFRWVYRNFLKDKNKPWKNQFDRIKDELKLGLDPILDIKFPAWRISPEVKIKIWKEKPINEKYPLLFKEYQTPKGSLIKIIYQTPDWPHGDDIPLLDDFQVPRSRTRKYLIEKLEDVEGFSSLFSEPNEKELEIFYEEAEKIKHFAEENGLLIINNFNVTEKDNTLFLGDALAWFCGIENMIFATYKNPILTHKILDTLLEWNKKYLKKILEANVIDVICYRGWYENTLFWPPKNYKKFIAPRVSELIKMAHDKKVKFCYIMTTNFIPLLDTFIEMGVDILFGPDPIQDKMLNLFKLKEKTKNKICLWGGVNAPITIGKGTKKQIEEAVKNAIDALSINGGFILSAIDTLEDCFSWENIKHMINSWEKFSKIL
ncbi:MAG: uroporphyrinogen decarboxylase family protein [Candidatus Aenigmatarchaeota archaeon]